MTTMADGTTKTSNKGSIVQPDWRANTITRTVPMTTFHTMMNQIVARGGECRCGVARSPHCLVRCADASAIMSRAPGPHRALVVGGPVVMMVPSG